jgi:hypothetical protein
VPSQTRDRLIIEIPLPESTKKQLELSDVNGAQRAF